MAGQGLTSWAPAEFRVHVLFASFLAMVAVGYCVRRAGIASQGDMEGLRKFVFGIGLPALLLGSTWRMEVTSDVLLSIPVCVFIHSVWAALAYLIHCRRGPQNRAWFVLTSQGVFLGYVYPFVAASPPDVASRIVGPALVWDLGGNMWMCLFWQEFIVGRLVKQSMDRRMAEENNAREIESPGVSGKTELTCAPRKTIIGEIMMENFDHHELIDSARTRSASFSGDTRTGEAVRRHLKNNNMREEELDALIFEWLPERFVKSDASLNNGTLDTAADEDETSVTLRFVGGLSALFPEAY
eukprot:CAMPEP_0169063330 /NCGR_PEP_ID=MMETSP1015-20121227/1224_1 /TAXON_ID=342587 /ORGANISM="Karlodinium micrum, Strain CCMP2283" /LENGTH=297 /DNA_ID=CAMNT_0009121653 /DNA_START=81 /DNA_END=975 /DNA_ORIENTATION=-